MKGYIEKLIPAVPVALVLGAMMFSHSCANTTTPPSGGDKDTIPPVITNISPLPGTVNVPVHNTQIVITFNEYVTVKDAKGIFLSPPLENLRNIRSEANLWSCTSSLTWNRIRLIRWI